MSMACSGGGNTKAGDGATPSPTSTPRIPLPSVDPAAAGEATKAVLTKADFGRRWKEFRAATGFLRDVGPNSRIGCAVEPSGGIASDAFRAVIDGAIFQRGTATRYVTSDGFGFADEVAARSAISAFRSSKWSACRAAEKTRVAKETDETTSWRVDKVDDSGRGNTLEAVIRFKFQAIVDGKLRDANGYETVLFYRVGSTILMIAVEGVAAESDPPKVDEAIDKELHAATLKALDRLRA